MPVWIIATGFSLLTLAGVDLGQRREALAVIGAAMQQPIVLILVGVQHLRVGDGDIGGDGMDQHGGRGGFHHIGGAFLGQRHGQRTEWPRQKARRAEAE